MRFLEMKEITGTAEALSAKLTRLSMQIANLRPAVGTILAGSSSATIARSIFHIPGEDDFADVHCLASGKVTVFQL